IIFQWRRLMQTNFLPLLRRACVSPPRAISTGALLLAASATLSARDAVRTDAVVPLDEFVVSAARSPQDPWLTPSSVTRVDLGELRDLQIDDLRSALDREAGIDIVNTGAPGSQS